MFLGKPRRGGELCFPNTVTPNHHTRRKREVERWRDKGAPAGDGVGAAMRRRPRPWTGEEREREGSSECQGKVLGPKARVSKPSTPRHHRHRRRASQTPATTSAR